MRWECYGDRTDDGGSRVTADAEVAASWAAEDDVVADEGALRVLLLLLLLLATAACVLAGCDAAVDAGGERNMRVDVAAVGVNAAADDADDSAIADAGAPEVTDA